MNGGYFCRLQKSAAILSPESAERLRKKSLKCILITEG